MVATHGKDGEKKESNKITTSLTKEMQAQSQTFRSQRRQERSSREIMAVLRQLRQAAAHGWEHHT